MSNIHTPTEKRIDPVTRLRRLRRAHHVILSVPKDGWNMHQWMLPRVEFDSYGREIPLKKEPNVCGTAGCALGNCGLDPVLRAEGLECSKVGDFRLHHRKIHWRDSPEQAGARFFGITLEEADRLFLPDRYDEEDITPKMVAKRVARLIEKYERALG